jgi:hypothetical protein
VIMHNRIIKNECDKDLDYTLCELMGHPVRVQRREESFYSLIPCHFETMKCMMIFKMISSRSGRNRMTNKTLKIDICVKL